MEGTSKFVGAFPKLITNETFTNNLSSGTVQFFPQKKDNPWFNISIMLQI